MDSVTTEAKAPALPVFIVEDLAGLLDAFGVGGKETPESRVVTLSESSTVECPLHGRRLIPDACRSCCFLAA